jgi:hypothetical protein
MRVSKPVNFELMDQLRRPRPRPPFLLLSLLPSAIGVIFLVFLRPPDPVIVAHPAPPISLPSIAINENIGTTQVLNPDLRGNFWEWQLPQFPGDYSVHYLGDGPCRLLNNKSCLVLPSTRSSYVDQKCCVRTGESWKHFAQFESHKKWYFRGTHDTFVNMTALLKMIQKFESQIDPMKEFQFAFNFHEYDRVYYPHGGTGWLFSNYAVQQFVTRINAFEYECDHSLADDVFMPRWFSEFGLSVENYQTNQFIVTFPNSQLEIVLDKQFNLTSQCPTGYRLFGGAKPLVPGRVHNAASIHMHKVPMDLAYRVLLESPEDFAVTFPNPNTPVFCRKAPGEA